MRLDTVALIAVVVASSLYLIALVLGLAAAGPLGWLALAPVAVGLYLLIGVIRQRIGSKDDDRYDQIER